MPSRPAAVGAAAPDGPAHGAKGMGQPVELFAATGSGHSGGAVAGELVVAAAGDDISLPHRVETLTSEWIRSGKPSGIGSASTPMDDDGKLIESSGPVSNSSRLPQMPQKNKCCAGLPAIVNLRSLATLRPGQRRPGTNLAISWRRLSMRTCGAAMPVEANKKNSPKVSPPAKPEANRSLISILKAVMDSRNRFYRKAGFSK